jgi:hypothetical protein
VLLERDEVGRVAEAAHIVLEGRGAALHEELREDDVTHRHRERGVGARVRCDPLVGELRVVGVVG